MKRRQEKNASRQKKNKSKRIDDGSDEDDQKYKEEDIGKEMPGEEEDATGIDPIGGVEGEEDDTGHDFDGGYAVEAFNMNNERATGDFDDDMGYTERKEKLEPDAWIAEYDDAITDKKKANKFIAKDIQPDSKLGHMDEEVDPVALRKAILQHLAPKESVTGALKRYSTLAKNKKTSTEDQAANKKIFDEITEAAHTLIITGDTDIYTDKKADLEKYIEDAQKSHTVDLPPSIAPSGGGVFDDPDEQWEYKTPDGHIYGPHSRSEMRAWFEAGYFNDDAAMIRKKKVESIYDDDDQPEAEFQPAASFASVFLPNQ
eukprot:TRINITY_DN12996_c0_g1_i1.p1 TRINITY_DN12996_c0_g1~~TRINITY_DN12996_c0_g1_i1.p1  ORF type:complete len:315 (-),score=102.00 TRINITY_DN12996_c0_g1_i1:723-1667(-)